MKNYGLFYSYKNIGDVLIVIFNNELTTTKTERKGRVEVIYHDDEIIGYNIFDVKDIIKIHSQGKIYLPSPALVEIINYFLRNEGLETLEITNHSGYYIGEIISEDKVDIGEELLEIEPNQKLQKGDKVVVIKKGTITSNGSLAKKTIICTAKELGLQGEEVLLIDKELENGKDFFSTEEK